MNKFILVLNGPMCAGKSTVTKILMERENIFRGSFDAIKWLIGNYSADNEFYRKVAKEIVFSAVSTAVQSGLSVVIDGGFADFREKFKNLAEQHGYKYLSINMEAPLDVLENRFLERVEYSKKVDSNKISIKTLEGFHLRYQWYLNKNKDIDGILFDSHALSPNQIIKEIDDILKTK